MTGRRRQDKDMFADNLKERKELLCERLQEFKRETASQKKATDQWIFEQSDFLLYVFGLEEEIKSGAYFQYSLEQLRAVNRRLYRDVSGENYEKSFCDPDVAVRAFGKERGQLIAFLSYELRGTIGYVFEGKTAFALAPAETFVEVACAAKGDVSAMKPEALRDTLYWFLSDTSDDYIEDRTADQVVTGHTPFVEQIMRADYADPRFLYWSGEYVTPMQEKLAAALNALPEDKIKKMAFTFTDGYRRGFELGRKDLSKKKSLDIRYEAGFERLVAEEIRQFKALGLEPCIYRSAVSLINRRLDNRVGFFGAIPNRQMEYDHRYDDALFLDSALVERKLGALEHAYEQVKEEALAYGGPALMDTFGEDAFSPVPKDTAPKRSRLQQELSVKYSAQAGAIVDRYIPGEQRSFSIISWPTPSIGRQFDEILNATLDLNTLDNAKYQQIQRHITDALSGASYAIVKGANGNQTDLKISLQLVTDPMTQSSFENCLADVNIPVGEVFTTPVLKDTNGTLAVSHVYLNGLRYDDLFVTLKDGLVTEYGCGNFKTAQEGKAYFAENVLFGHKTLPIGEFAIGTNTKAYAVGRKYGIEGKYTILIAEKTGPHFALGDTCYSHEEDNKTFNPDGKEIVARENDFSRKRKTDPEGAYFNCHTDITIPYDEIGEIAAVRADGTKVDILKNGRFVLPGTEELNGPLDALAAQGAKVRKSV